MKKSLLLTATIIALSASTAAYAISVTGNANAVIKATISATETQRMNFGTISSAATAGIVKISPAGSVSSSTNDFYATPSPNAGIFSITAEPSTQLTVSFTNGTLTSGANSMALSNFTTTSSPASNTTAPTTGALTLNVGADLAIGAAQASGSYVGTYNVTLSY